MGTDYLYDNNLELTTTRTTITTKTTQPLATVSPLNVVIVVVCCREKESGGRKKICVICAICVTKNLDLGIAERLRKVGVSLLESPGL